MKLSISLILIVLFSGCNKTSVNGKERAKARAKELKAREYINSLPEPHFKIIPDSMKKWLPVFDSIRNRDQRFRSVADPTLLFRHQKEQASLDSLNLVLVLQWLNQYGYPEFKMAGVKGIMAIKLVLQHAPLDVQEKYYQLTTEAYSEGKAHPETLALLEDRINARNNRVQYYGTQLIYYKETLVPFPVHNIDSIDIYRKQVGLTTTFDEYIQGSFKIKFDQAKYKLDLPSIKKFKKVTDTPGIRFVKPEMDSTGSSVNH